MNCTNNLMLYFKRREKSMDIERFREKYLRKAQKVLSGKDYLIEQYTPHNSYIAQLFVL